MIRIRRILAISIDVILSIIFMLIALFISALVTLPIKDGEHIDFILAIAMIVFWIAFIIFKDAIFGGRSFGKRLFRLGIYDSISLEPVTRKRCILRNITIPLFTNTIDLLLVLITGKSIGDRIAGTVVLSKAEAERCLAELKSKEFDPEQRPAPKRRRKVLFVVVVLAASVVLYLAIATITRSILVSKMDTDEYRISLEYLINSDLFMQLEPSLDDVTFNGYTVSTSLAGGDGHGRKTASLRFNVRGAEMTVVSHFENGAWIVCEECTKFK